MSDWTVARVEQLAPDPASAKAGQGLAKASKWQNLGQRDGVVWGECQGSGANPYQVRASLGDLGYRCTCPSRKQPCKHTLGLLLLYAGGTPLPDAEPPAFVVEWQANRAKRAEAKVARESAPESAPDPEAQAKRVEKREARIETGLDQLEAWLADAIAQGLASVRAQPASWWQQMQARLVDAQAPGLARRVRDLADAALAQADWQARLLAGLARLQLLVDAYRRVDALPLPLAAEVRTLVGWTQKQEDVLAGDAVRDRWHVLARRQSEQDTLRVQSTWLRGATTGRHAYVLEFAVGRQPLPVSFAVGQVFDGELAFFAGATPGRALVKSRQDASGARASLGTAADIGALQAEFASGLAANPWLERWSCVLGPVVPTFADDVCVLVDDAGRRIRVRHACRQAWHLAALAGGEPLAVFGEWNGFEFDVLAAQRGATLYAIAELGELPLLAKVG